MTPITVQFLHQHKNKVIYENQIWMDSPTLIRTEDGKFSVIFEMPLFIDRPFIKRWVNSSRTKRITCRVLRFATNDDTILYSLPKRPLEASFRVFCDLSANIHIEFEPTKEEIHELSKIFSK